MFAHPEHSHTTLLAIEADSARAERLAAALSEAWLVDLGVALVESLEDGCDRIRATQPACVIVGAGLLSRGGVRALEAVGQADADVPVVALLPSDADAATVDALAAASDEQLPEAEVSEVSVGRVIRYAIERKETDLQLAYEAFHDPLTGLPNRRNFVERVERALASADHDAQVGVCLIDIDHFALATDEVGQAAGDELLFEIGTRLHQALRGADVVARYGGDEFAVMAAGAPNTDLGALARRAVDAVRAEPFAVAGHTLALEACAGVAVSAGERDPGMLLRNAEAALASAKRSKDDVMLYRSEMRSGPLRRLQLRAELEAALERGEFRVHYQPQVRLSDRRVIGIEALLRWEHPERGRVLPGQFIHVAEESGLIVPIGQYVLATACADVRSWGLDANGDGGVAVSVNLSVRQLGEAGLVDAVAETVAASGIDSAQLCLEITETLAMERAETTMSLLSELKQLGIRIALDDFGTGYSSLSYLDRLPIDVLKIDRAFISGIDLDPRKRRIIGAVSGLADGLELKWLAEGVENAGELEELEQLGCDLVQGFYFGKPQPIGELAGVGQAS